MQRRSKTDRPIPVEVSCRNPPTTWQGDPLPSRASQDLWFGASHVKNPLLFQEKKPCAKTERDCPMLHKSPNIRENYGKYFLLLLFFGTTFSSMLQKFFALSWEGRYFYQDIAHCKYFGLALSFAKTKSSILGST